MSQENNRQREAVHWSHAFIGQVVADKYRIEQVLGHGGFASVFRARHISIKSLLVAIKILKEEHACDTEVIRRFQLEAELCASLKDPHIVDVMDFGVTAQGYPYLVMEHINGVLLSDLLRRDRRLRTTDVARLSLNMLQALEEAHDARIIHRDMKPSNVFVVATRGQRHPIAKVLDFGIAKVLQDSEIAPAHETIGASYCTPRYAAPELLKGNPLMQSDLYALGHMMAFMLDGKPPYGKLPNNMILSSAHLSPEPVPLGNETMASGLGHIVARAVAKSLEERYSSAQEMSAELAEAYRYLNVNPDLEPPLELNIEGYSTIDHSQPSYAGFFPATPSIPFSSSTSTQNQRGDRSTSVERPEKSVDTGPDKQRGNLRKRRLALLIGALIVMVFGAATLTTIWIIKDKRATPDTKPTVAQQELTPVAIGTDTMQQVPTTQVAPETNDDLSETGLNSASQPEPSQIEAPLVALTTTHWHEALSSATLAVGRASTMPIDQWVSLRGEHTGILAWHGQTQLGELPLVGYLPRADRPLTLRFTGDGYREQEMIFDDTGPIAARVQLRRERRPSSQAAQDSQEQQPSAARVSGSDQAQREPEPAPVEPARPPSDLRNPFGD